jgi:PAS domain S-box-containing protein
MTPGRKLAIRTALISLISGLIWIFTSDQILLQLSEIFNWELNTITRIQNVKGVFFVIVMAFVIYSLSHSDYLKFAAKEKQYRELFDANPAPMIIFDIKTLAILRCNNAAIQKYGYSREEFKALTLVDIRPEGEETRLRRSVSSEDVELADKGLWLHKKKNGDVFWVHVFSHRTEFRGIKARLALLFDVHSSVVTQNKINEQNIRLKRINWSQSHDLRAPVAQIMGLTDLINYSEPSDPANREIIARIRKASKDLDEVVREISAQTYETYKITGESPETDSESGVS